MLTDDQIESEAARIASLTLDATRVHEIGGETTTIFNPNGLLQFARAILAASQPATADSLPDERAEAEAEKFVTAEWAGADKYLTEEWSHYTITSETRAIVRSAWTERARLAAPGVALEAPQGQTLWLWKNFVDGRPEYWAFDNPYPCVTVGGDPLTLGEPCGWAILKPSVNGRPDRPASEVFAAAIRRAAQVSTPKD